MKREPRDQKVNGITVRVHKVENWKHMLNEGNAVGFKEGVGRLVSTRLDW